MKNDLTIYAGPCSVDEHNLEEIYQIAEVASNGKKAITGTRVVGLKSRTELMKSSTDMGMDLEAVASNLEILARGGSHNDFSQLPSIDLAAKIHRDTGLNIATETLLPHVQLPLFAREFAHGGLMPWNPAVNQLGWSLAEMAVYARENNWDVGIKNGKWIGDKLPDADSADYAGQTPIEKVWAGLVKYVGEIRGDVVLIHRGLDVPEKGNYRNLPVHNIARRTKLASGAKLFFDPSHSYGPKMRGDIVDATVEAMRMQTPDGDYLYDGILIEAGTSKTDTEQHITLGELQEMCERLSEFRTLKGR